jgi:hypothetical protein
MAAAPAPEDGAGMKTTTIPLDRPSEDRRAA